MNMRRDRKGSESETTATAVLPVRVTAQRAVPMIAYTVILASALSGYAGVGLWAIPLTALALVMLSHAEYGGLYRRGKALGLDGEVTSTILQSACNAAIACGGAYAVGLLFRLI